MRALRIRCTLALTTVHRSRGSASGGCDVRRAQLLVLLSLC